MRISTRGRYGLKAIVFIGAYGKDKCVSLRNISEVEGISENYLEQLISPLKKAGLVKSVRGAYGGYKLNKEPKDISVGDILLALEGSLAPVECVNKEGENSCSCGTNCGEDCITKDVWEEINSSVLFVVDNIPLEQLIEKYKMKSEKVI
ncbi:MAG: RrF2 family transcriptional regulator [Lachnospirales bacterium]